MMIGKIKTFSFVILALYSLQISAFTQNIDCDLIYFVNNSKIYAYNPLMETYEYIGLSSPDGASGLGIGKDIINKADKLTFFCTVSEYLYYYDGKKWVNTNHLAYSVNLCGGGDYWYILDGIDSKVYKYNGNGNAIELLDFPSYSGPFDLVGDSKGNFYMIFTKLNKMVQYNSDGKVLKQYRIDGLSGQTSGGGFAYRDNKLYGNFSNGSMIGSFKGGVVRFTPTNLLPSSVDDFASCPLEIFEPPKDTSKIDSVRIIQSTDVVFTNGNIPLTIKDREVKLQSTITVSQAEFDIEIWDKSVADGDSISLNLNGDWILESYEVVKTKLKMKVKINPDSPNNYLILYAHNLGEISPNTAAVSVLIDGQEYKLTLTSDLKTSGALNFVYQPK